MEFGVTRMWVCVQRCCTDMPEAGLNIVHAPTRVWKDFNTRPDFVMQTDVNLCLSCG